MSLESKSRKLKEIIATYNEDWLLGDLFSLIHAGRERASDQLGGLSSPQRQLYYLAGLNVTSDPSNGYDVRYDPEKWNQIVTLLNEIEAEYTQLFFPSKPEDVTEEWKRVRQVAMPSFLSYFNQGPLNYQEQVVNWVRDLFSPLDGDIENATGVKTEDFIRFYESLDQLRHKNFQAHTLQKELLRPNWNKYTKIKMGVAEEAPDFIKEMGEEYAPTSTYLTDKGVIDRFYPSELITKELPEGKVRTVLNLLSTKRSKTDFLYYTETRPGNPLYERPILDIGDGMYQVFDVKQVIHAVNKLLEKVSAVNKDKYIARKGTLLEDRIEDLFKTFLKDSFKIYRGYYVDSCEQDILVLWKKYAFIIETKGYALREPFRDPDKAFVRITNDFKASIGYGHEQSRRIEKKFIDEVPLRITDKNGKVIDEIDTTLYEFDFSIIVNLESFGQVQCDLSTLLKLENEDDLFPWAVTLDDLEIFFLTMIAQKRRPEDFVDFLLMRETLHGKLVCSDELEICGGFLSSKLKKARLKHADVIITKPDLGDIFDSQYRKTMGFKNERNLYEKQSGKFLFW
ncbi:hypothetical protein WSM22_40460 [Cytophagales bacterium WSM2-2]|nr:hypothetical protein WSM22_40460 [Cytophagales bacterium WSM2-2]